MVPPSLPARIVLALPLLLFAAEARADRDWIPPVTDPLTKQECGECHMAFQPGFLPARSWERLMATLPDHFGDDASLSPNKAEAINRYLQDNAGDRRGGGFSAKFMRWVDPAGTPIRFTENPRFVKEHRKIDREALKRTPIKSLTNCTACHRRAEQGDYDD